MARKGICPNSKTMPRQKKVKHPTKLTFLELLKITTNLPKGDLKLFLLKKAYALDKTLKL